MLRNKEMIGMEKTTKRIYIGEYKSFPKQLGKTVVFDDQSFAVFKSSDGELFALENRCPCKGGILADGMVSGAYLYSPMHDWKISLRDGSVQAPDEGNVKSFPVAVEEDKVFITVG